MKRVRILLRVSSNQQLEADGDLSVQRQLVQDYIQQHEDWRLDNKEYFEGSSSGYKNTVDKRDILQEALADAKKANMTFWPLIRMTGLADACGKLVRMS